MLRAQAYKKVSVKYSSASITRTKNVLLSLSLSLSWFGLLLSCPVLHYKLMSSLSFCLVVVLNCLVSYLVMSCLGLPDMTTRYLRVHTHGVPVCTNKNSLESRSRGRHDKDPRPKTRDPRPKTQDTRHKTQDTEQDKRARQEKVQDKTLHVLIPNFAQKRPLWR